MQTDLQYRSRSFCEAVANTCEMLAAVGRGWHRVDDAVTDAASNRPTVSAEF
jgi:hypothetical protein